MIVLMSSPSRHASNLAVVSQSDVTVFAVRDDAAVRSAPTTLNSAKLGTLGRGAQIQGTWLERNAAGYRWFKVSSGPFAGDYVWERNLSPMAPAQLSAAIGADRRALATVNAYSSPDLNAPVADTIAARHPVFVVGSVDGGWYEIRLKHGGIAYVQSSNIN